MSKCFDETPESSYIQASVMHINLILMAFITGNISLEPLREGLLAQIQIDLS